MIRTDKRIRLCTALLIANLVFIWGNSLLPGEVSGALSDCVKDLLEAILPGEETTPSGGGLLRKAAHFTEFCSLGILLTWWFGMLGKKKRYAFLCGAAAACLDETIQMFVPDRGPGLKDVCIDSCGVAAGIILLHFGHTYLKKRSTRNTLEDK